MLVGISTMVLFRERIYVQRRMKGMLIITCRYASGDNNNGTLVIMCREIVGKYINVSTPFNDMFVGILV